MKVPTDGGAVDVVASGFGSNSSIVLDDASVYWTADDGERTRLMKAPK